VLLNENNTAPSSTRDVKHREAHSVQTEQNRTAPAEQQAQALTRLRQEGAETSHNTNTENSFKVYVLSAFHEKVPAANAIYAHAQDVAASDELLLAILKTFIPQSMNKQQTIGFRVF
jgi:hypothetical protein